MPYPTAGQLPVISLVATPIRGLDFSFVLDRGLPIRLAGDAGQRCTVPSRFLPMGLAFPLPCSVARPVPTD